MRYHSTIESFIDQHAGSRDLESGARKRGRTLLAWPGLVGLVDATHHPGPPVDGRPDTHPIDGPGRGPSSEPDFWAVGTPARVPASADTDQLVESYLDRAEAAADERERAAVLRELARLLEHNLGDPESAFAVRVFAYRIQPERSEWDDLERLAARAAQWDELCAAYEAAEPHLPPAHRADACWRLARLYAQRLDLTHRALASAGEALALDPAHGPAWKLRVELLRKTGRWDELARVLAERLPVAQPEERMALQRELAQIREHHLDDLDGAIEQYEALRAERPGDIAVLRALDRLYGRAGRVRAHLDVLTAQAGLLEDVRALCAIYQRMAALWEDNLGEPGRAADCLEWALALGQPVPGAGELQRELRRLYRASGRWRAAVDACLRQAEAAAGPDERAALLVEAAEILAEDLDDPHQALALYTEAEAASAEPAALWPRLTELLVAAGDIPAAIDLLARRAGREPGAGARSEHYARAGELSCDQLDDPEAAERFFLQALQHRAGHTRVLARLAEIYQARGEAAAAVSLLEGALGHVDDQNERVRLLVQAADLAEVAGLRARAVALHRRALDEDPAHLHAATRVAELLWAAGDHAALVPVLRQLIELVRDPESLRRAWTRLGRAAHAMGWYEQAVAALEHARALGAEDPESLQAHAASLYHLKQWPEAAGALERLLAAHAAELSMRERHDARYMLGMCRRHMVDIDGARAQWMQVLAQDAGHRATLRAIADIETDPELRLAYIRTLAEHSHGAERGVLLREMGDLYRDAFADAESALAVYRQALLLQPRSHRLLHRCLDIHAGAEDWSGALDMLQRLIQIEEESPVRARYRCTVATILHEKQGRDPDALVYLRQALEDEPRLAQASRLLEELLTRAEDWAALRDHYSAQLQRLGALLDDGTRSECARLWARLGGLCRARFDDREGAIAALRVAAHLEPGEPDYHGALAALYVENGAHSADQAVAAYQAQLALAPRRAGAYEALERLFGSAGQLLRAQACAASLQVLSARRLCAPPVAARDPEPELFARPRRPLSREDWSRLRDAGEAGPVGALLALLAPALQAHQAGSRPRLGLRSSQRVDDSDERPFSRAFRRAVTVYGIEAPALYANPAQRHPIAFATEAAGGVLIPSLVVGRPTLSPAVSEDVLVFAFGRYLAHLCRERLVRLLAPTPDGVVGLVRAAVALEDPARCVEAPQARTVRVLERGLAPAAADQVITLAAGMDPGGIEDAVRAWLAATERTALRMALILAPALEACAATLEHEHADPDRRADRVLALARENVSEPVLDARDSVFL